MSVRVVDAVLASPLDRRLRFLAVVLATYADDEGGSVYPGVKRLAGQLGTQPRAVRDGLRQLRRLEVLAVESRMVKVYGQLCPAGGRGVCPTRYRFQLDVLAALSPPVPRKRRKVHGAAPFLPSITGQNDAADGAERCSPTPEKVQPDVGKGAAQDTRSVMIRPDPSGRETGGSAPVPPFKVYAAIATAAIARSHHEDQSEDRGTVTAWFKQLCAEQGKPYDARIAQKAIDAAFAARQKTAARNGHRRPRLWTDDQLLGALHDTLTVTPKKLIELSRELTVSIDRVDRIVTQYPSRFRRVTNTADGVHRIALAAPTLTEEFYARRG